MIKNKIILSSSLFLLLLGGCSSKENMLSVDQYSISYKKELEKISQKNDFKIAKEALKEDKKNSQKTEEIPIAKEKIAFFQKKGSTKKAKTITKKDIQLDVDSIPISKFTKLVFGQILQENFVMDSQVEKSKKTITLNITTPMDREKFLTIVKKLYISNGFYVEYEDETFYIKKGRSKTVSFQDIGNNVVYGRSVPSNIADDEVISAFIPYYYTQPAQFKSMLRYFLSKDSYQKIFFSKGIYLIRDKAKNIKKALELINSIDVPVMKTKTSVLLPMEYIDVHDFKKQLDSILPASGIRIGDKLNSLGILLKVVEPLNALLIISDKKEWIKIVKYWHKKLDIIDANSKESQFFVYQPKNRISTELKKLLDGLSSLSIDTNQKQKKKNTKNDDNKIKVIDDATRNKLIIYATPAKYKILLKMLEKLDVLPKQVLIEVTIAELTLKDSLSNGFEWFLQNSSGRGVLSTVGGLGLGGTGLSGSIINSTSKLQLYMNYFAQKNLINILSSPKIVVVDNQSATLNVGTEVPVLNSSSSTTDKTGAQTISQSVQYRSTGIILSVRPTIHSNNSLMLQITQTVSEAQANSTSTISSPMVLTRNINTNVVLKSEQTLMLGGLIRENKSTTDSKVPLLGDIPLIGNLFKVTQISSDKTELIVMIRPIVLNTTNDANIITNSFKEMLHHQDTK